MASLLYERVACQTGRAGCMIELAHLHELLSREYGLDKVTLSPIHHFANADRGVYRVDEAGQASLVQRVYQHERSAAVWLTESAATLLL